ncbi:MAG: hypothetical protein MPW15_26170 [Candidatus Manganitrophus sp.]|nr:hypothetical protein [Candidatus Manganitrophus sp.]
MKTQFLSNVSHELRTPLHAIIGYTYLALDGTYGPFDPALRPAMEGVTRNAEGLLQLVDDLLDLTRIEAGKVGDRTVVARPHGVAQRDRLRHSIPFGGKTTPSPMAPRQIQSRRLSNRTGYGSGRS